MLAEPPIEGARGSCPPVCLSILMRISHKNKFEIKTARDFVRKFNCMLSLSLPACCESCPRKYVARSATREMKFQDLAFLSSKWCMQRKTLPINWDSDSECLEDMETDTKVPRTRTDGKAGAGASTAVDLSKWVAHPVCAGVYMPRPAKEDSKSPGVSSALSRLAFPTAPSSSSSTRRTTSSAQPPGQ